MKKSKYKAKKEEGGAEEVEASAPEETAEPEVVPEGPVLHTGQIWRKDSEISAKTYEEAKKLFDASSAERKRVRRRQAGFGFVTYKKVERKAAKG